LQAIRDNAVATADVGAYLNARAELDKKKGSVLEVPQSLEISREALNAAGQTRWNGNIDSWRESGVEELRKELEVALSHMPDKIITDAAVEHMAYTSLGDYHWRWSSPETKDMNRELARKALEAAAPHLGIELDRTAAIRNWFRQKQNNLIHAVDNIAESKENVEGTVSAGLDKIAERHEKPIPSEIGGSTVAWSDLNPFKSPFKNGKLR
jgi:hypothetical protein